ncbi:MAG TPA: hypothetical protein VF634_07895 [Pyrinomonadaceae bacterium]
MKDQRRIEVVQALMDAVHLPACADAAVSWPLSNECLRVVVDIPRPVNYLYRRSSRTLPVTGFPIALTS